MHKIVSLIVGLLWISLACAQSNPAFVTGQVPSAAQWNSYFSGKLDYQPNGLYPSIVGVGPLTQPLIVDPSTTSLNNQLQIGDGCGTSQGWIIGNGASGVSRMWTTCDNPTSTTNYRIGTGTTSTRLNAPPSGMVQFYVGGDLQVQIPAAAGANRYVSMMGSNSGAPLLTVAGTTNVAFDIAAQGSSSLFLGSGAARQVEIQSVAGATNLVQIAGSVGSGATIGTNGGNLNLASSTGTQTVQTLSVSNGINLQSNRALFLNNSPTISSGFGSGSGVTFSNGTATFRVNVGTGGSASSGVVSLPTASNGWNCFVSDMTARGVNAANVGTFQTASTTNTVTVQNQTLSTGSAVAWTASDILIFNCMAF